MFKSDVVSAEALVAHWSTVHKQLSSWKSCDGKTCGIVRYYITADRTRTDDSPTLRCTIWSGFEVFRPNFELTIELANKTDIENGINAKLMHFIVHCTSLQTETDNVNTDDSFSWKTTRRETTIFDERRKPTESEIPAACRYTFLSWTF